MTDTPRTEAAIRHSKDFDEADGNFDFVSVEFAQMLERELNTAREELEKLHKFVRSIDST